MAQVKVREWEAEGTAPRRYGNVTVDAACEAFRDDAKARGLSKATLKKYRVLSDQMKDFSEKQGIRHIRQFDLAAARAFRASWKDGARSAGKKLERLRSMFAFFVTHKWVAENYAKAMTPPIVHSTPTLPYTEGEFNALVEATKELPTVLESMKERTRAMLYVLRYTGLRISDAVRLTDKEVGKTAVTLRMAKTRVAVTIPLVAGLRERLEAIKFPNGRYFSTGEAQIDTDTGNWRRRFAKLAAIAQVKNAHLHRLRDTFAVELLIQGVPIEDVSILLGHSSVKITERDYAPWVQARQIRLEKVIQEVNKDVKFST